MSTGSKLGLVLSGGGAKGAYQVGFLKALAELGIEIDAVSGASIGALNGAVVACSPSLLEAADRLERLWKALGDDSPLTIDKLTLVKLTATFAAMIGVPSLVGKIGAFWGVSSDWNLLDNSPVKALLEEYISPAQLAGGAPLFVSVYPSSRNRQAVREFLTASIGLSDTRDSEFIHVQSLPTDQQMRSLLASAALPFLFSAQTIQGSKYHDGGIGGKWTAQGNTPITPLVDAGCTGAIVAFLSDGSLWRRQDFPEIDVIEIRPQSLIKKNGTASDLLGFDSSSIELWMEQGYNDALACLKPIMKAAQSVRGIVVTQKEIVNSHALTSKSEASMTDAMTKLKNRKNRVESLEMLQRGGDTSD